MILDRREMVAGFGAFSLASLVGGKSAHAATGAAARLVVVNLRGGMDGMAALAPYGDPLYRKLRGPLALPAPGAGPEGLLKADGLFGFHPGLINLHKMFHRGELLAVQGVAIPYRTWSHFEGQDVLGNGTQSPKEQTGWLNRAVAALPTRAANAEYERSALALGGLLPMMMRGPGQVASWSPAGGVGRERGFAAQLRTLYAEDPLFARLWGDVEAANRLAGNAGLPDPAKTEFRRFADLMDASAGMLNANDGLRILTLETTGWDTHAHQGGHDGKLASRFAELDRGIGRLRARLDSAVWRRTVVLVLTEFGRTVRGNGTRGTDHGTGGLAIAAGGAVAGGRIAGDWRGLSDRDLYASRDIFPAVDMRSLIKGILRDHIGLRERALETTVFPDSRDAPGLEGLIA